MAYIRFGQTQASCNNQIVYTYEGQGLSPALISQLAPNEATFVRRLLSEPRQAYIMTSTPAEIERLTYQKAIKSAFRPGFLTDCD